MAKENLKNIKSIIKNGHKDAGPDLDWHRLDNAALIYPAVSTKKWNAVYRVSAILKETVDKNILNQALADIIKRFPHFNVSLKRGLFWFYFQEITTIPIVQLDNDYACRRMEFRSDKHLFRVFYYNKKVSFEVFHSLTDGYGAIVFLNTLLSRYFDLLGYKINKKDYVLNYLDKPASEEIEDSFSSYADLKSKNSRKENKAYQIAGTKEEHGKLNIVNAIMDAQAIKEMSHKYDATVTELLLAVLFKAILKNQQKNGYIKKPVRISVPINLRRFFDSKTLRNFSSYTNMQFNQNAVNFDLKKMINEIKKTSRKIDKSYLMGNINANVLAQRNIFLRVVPIFIKNFFLKIAYYFFGERFFTTALSNLGLINAPKKFNELVDRYEINLGPSKLNKMGMAIATFNNKLVFSFSSTIKETDLQRDFVRILTDMGAKIKIESNMR